MEYLFVLPVGEPDSPVLSSDEMKVEGNTFSIPLKQIDDGGTPLLHFNIRYRQVSDGGSVSLSLYICLIPTWFSWLILLFNFLRTQKGLNGKKCSCHMTQMQFPSKTWLSAQTINWRCQLSTLMVPLRQHHSTSPLQSSLVGGSSDTCWSLV